MTDDLGRLSLNELIDRINSLNRAMARDYLDRNAAQAAQEPAQDAPTPPTGGQDGRDAPRPTQSHLRARALDAAHHATTQGGQAGIASGLAAIALAILAGQETP